LDYPAPRESAAAVVPGKKLANEQKHMRSISCKEAVGYILKKEEGKLSVIGHLKLWQHLVICSLCRIFSSQNKLVHQKKDAEYKLSEDEKESIIRQVLNRDDK
jgi:hypothetical protein